MCTTKTNASLVRSLVVANPQEKEKVQHGPRHGIEVKLACCK